jgi:hypothetical protein
MQWSRYFDAFGMYWKMMERYGSTLETVNATAMDSLEPALNINAREEIICQPMTESWISYMKLD